ncbi:hypothetical protein BO94DRAFT_22553 [Aspergillus sclerotioniger CBS 115572]|uniref:Tyrosine specific protein phosphatases domain-containing protein n=1 Tax=Aspergillus sclerotioniger CBS 115572 TaxID=1450535 RepID=A0A317X1A9_9EURO|nr:hypothetical protein BO94DRAFT_22553 [Aspergillus sclerotioniger CBS 115572]PWY90320.1 hypothetical protein BO94DRAFT_22553 [Aspergillus sclerotioniger CBS 115572]
MSCYEVFPSNDLPYPIHSKLPVISDIDGLSNFRDVGGYPVAGGGSIRKGMLFRSSNLDDITQSGAQKLQTRHGVQAIFDLRSGGEIVESSRYLSAIPVTHVPALADFDDDQIVAYLKGLATDDTSAVTAELYLWICAMSTVAFRAVFTYLRDHPGCPVLIHCELGKDRTGICMAIILLVLEASDQDITRDYQLSEQGIKGMIPGRRLKLSELPLLVDSAVPPVALDRHFLVSSDTMRRFLMRFRQTYGSGEGYLQAIGFSCVDCDVIRSNLVAHPVLN